eukprot:2369469-Alexandrium_andersonii.AAC.1
MARACMSFASCGSWPCCCSVATSRSSARTLGLTSGSSEASNLTQGVVRATEKSMDHGPPWGILQGRKLTSPHPSAKQLTTESDARNPA